MAIQTKSLSATTEKWQRRAGVASDDYKKGVQSPKRPWQASTKAAEELYEAGVQESIGRKGFGAGVGRVSDSEWKDAAVQKGAKNYAPGVRYGVPKYSKRMGPVLAHMQTITLPAPGARGSPANIERSSTFQREMAKFRTG